MALIDPVEVIAVNAFGNEVGAIAATGVRNAYTFEFAPSWSRRKIELFPLLNPTSSSRQAGTPGPTFRGLLPGIADALPDDFGSAIIDAWLSEQGLRSSDVSALDRLAYTGSRALGALEFEPDRPPEFPRNDIIRLRELVGAARDAVSGNLGRSPKSALERIIEVGSSAGGARAKAIVNIHADGTITPGHVLPPAGSQAWLIKFDGVTDGRLGAGDPYTRIEYAYSLMARDAGIPMTETRLIEEGGRAHFATRRFDRPGGATKLHMQSLCGLAGLDFRQTDTHSYAQYLDAADRLGLGQDAFQQIFRRMVFNVLAANRDDHTKNAAFLMDDAGRWSLAPAFDLTHAYRPDSEWVARHQMSVMGKFDGISRRDVLQFADRAGVEAARSIVAEVRQSVGRWSHFAAEAGIERDRAQRVADDLVAMATMFDA